jgi:hypothetical protein
VDAHVDLAHLPCGPGVRPATSRARTATRPKHARKTQKTRAHPGRPRWRAPRLRPSAPSESARPRASTSAPPARHGARVGAPSNTAVTPARIPVFTGCSTKRALTERRASRARAAPVRAWTSARREPSNALARVPSRAVTSVRAGV